MVWSVVSRLDRPIVQSLKAYARLDKTLYLISDPQSSNPADLDTKGLSNKLTNVDPTIGTYVITFTHIDTRNGIFSSPNPLEIPLWGPPIPIIITLNLTQVYISLPSIQGEPKLKHYPILS